VDAAYRDAEEFLGLPLVDFESVSDAYPPSAYGMFVALSYSGMNSVRRTKFEAAKDKGYNLPSYVSSRCSWLSDEPPGENCFILEDNTVQPFVRIGSNVTLWSGNHLGHDSVVGDHCFISSHVVVSGHCTIGESCFLGVNATLRNGLTLAPETLVGAGAIIMKDTVERGVYVGPRAEKLPTTSDQVKL
jgi:sugar O-acyltransferase (sialic acid O-acetyltransferase NeuD family)